MDKDRETSHVRANHEPAPDSIWVAQAAVPEVLPVAVVPLGREQGADK